MHMLPTLPLTLLLLVCAQQQCVHGKKGRKAKHKANAFDAAAGRGVPREQLYAALETRDLHLPCTIDRRGPEITPAEFQAEYFNRRPVVLTNGSALAQRGTLGDAQTEIRRLLGVEYAKRVVRTGRPEELTRGPSAHTEKLSEFLRRSYTEENPLFLFQHDLLQSAPELRAFSHQPPVIPEFEARLIFSIGQDGAGLPLHEHAQTWSELVVGRKRWSLYHADAHPLPPAGFSPLQTHVQWLLHNYTSLTPAELPMECEQHPGDVVYLPDGWLHGTVSLGTTVSFTHNGVQPADSAGHFAHLDGFAQAARASDEVAALAHTLAGVQASPGYFQAHCYLAGAYNKVSPELLEREVAGVEPGGGAAARRGLVVGAYERCLALNQANPMTYQAYAEALSSDFGDPAAAADVLERMLAATHAHPLLQLHEGTRAALANLRAP